MHWDINKAQASSLYSLAVNSTLWNDFFLLEDAQYTSSFSALIRQCHTRNEKEVKFALHNKLTTAPFLARWWCQMEPRPSTMNWWRWKCTLETPKLQIWYMYRCPLDQISTLGNESLPSPLNRWLSKWISLQEISCNFYNCSHSNKGEIAVLYSLFSLRK